MTGKTDREKRKLKVNATLIDLEHRIIELERAIEMLIARMPGGSAGPQDPSDDPEWF